MLPEPMLPGLSRARWITPGMAAPQKCAVMGMTWCMNHYYEWREAKIARIEADGGDADDYNFALGCPGCVDETVRHLYALPDFVPSRIPAITALQTTRSLARYLPADYGMALEASCQAGDCSARYDPNDLLRYGAIPHDQWVDMRAELNAWATGPALWLGRKYGSSCDYFALERTFACYGMPGWSYRGGGTTFGNVFLTGNSRQRVMVMDTERGVLGHEWGHSDQTAFYGKDFWHIYLSSRTGAPGGGGCNVFEQGAGYYAGYYDECL